MTTSWVKRDPKGRIRHFERFARRSPFAGALKNLVFCGTEVILCPVYRHKNRTNPTASRLSITLPETSRLYACQRTVRANTKSYIGNGSVLNCFEFSIRFFCLMQIEIQFINSIYRWRSRHYCFSDVVSRAALRLSRVPAWRGEFEQVLPDLCLPVFHRAVNAGSSGNQPRHANHENTNTLSQSPCQRKRKFASCIQRNRARRSGCQRAG